MEEALGRLSSWDRRLASLIYFELSDSRFVELRALGLLDELIEVVARSVERRRQEKILWRRVAEHRCSPWSPLRAAEIRDLRLTRAEQDRMGLFHAMRILGQFKHPAFPTWEQAGLPADQKSPRLQVQQ